jgi:beta-glucosidase
VRSAPWNAGDPAASIEAALAAVRNADIAFLVFGDVLSRFGEYKSTATLRLGEECYELARRVRDFSVPYVAVLVSSKPLVLDEIARHAAAVIAAFNPGMEGGTAIADVAFGHVNPSGRLSVSWPLHGGQSPVHYRSIPGGHGGYADIPAEPAYPFGYGLGYSTFRYTNLAMATPVVPRNGSLRASVTVTNTGAAMGTEVVQWYLHDRLTSATWPTITLKGFSRLALAPGESRSVPIELPYASLAIIDRHGRETVEPGSFILYAGPCADTKKCLAAGFEAE